ncbi:MAG TPA: hypothetical protein VN445_01385 [Rectinemataceae bacterium]|nr:hypothetical protein [Rectinemataceae bacterium]
MEMMVNKGVKRKRRGRAGVLLPSSFAHRNFDNGAPMKNWKSATKGTRVKKSLIGANKKEKLKEAFLKMVLYISISYTMKIPMTMMTGTILTFERNI